MTYEYNIKENPISLNDWYGSRHWGIRKKQKDTWFKIFKDAISDNPPEKIVKYRLELSVNSRHDPSNTITIIKIFEDTLKELGYIIDDSPKYCKEIILRPDENLPKKSFKLLLEKIN